MYEHYDMECRVNLDLYNEALSEIDDLKQERDELKEKRDELKEENKYLTTKVESLNIIIKELYKELKEKDAKNIQEN